MINRDYYLFMVAIEAEKSDLKARSSAKLHTFTYVERIGQNKMYRELRYPTKITLRSHPAIITFLSYELTSVDIKTCRLCNGWNPLSSLLSNRHM